MRREYKMVVCIFAQYKKENGPIHIRRRRLATAYRKNKYYKVLASALIFGHVWW
ncbi:hypothetical protein IQ26_04838 [Mesorhizobium tianshanense]|uniref:Transposase n=1 Tax=Mesorhizobium tianshanense TaxID=39844 RepID=A0A562NCW0_9HYPH|nr:hypothetical protein IQ26_04838 [Mesorhizobium tianshanense]